MKFNIIKNLMNNVKKAIVLNKYLTINMYNVKIIYFQ